MDRRPRLLILYADSVYAVRCSRYFRRRGWDVHLAASGNEACQLVGSLAPTAVVIDGELPRDHARDTCTRLGRDHPGLTVVLATPDHDDVDRPASAGAVLVPRRHGAEALAEHLVGVSP
ncbi:MAG: hypothetical protein L0Y71_03320 [Gemmataceae bacterium]|nr:hypothetical protein [Gemmataceae bacterium]